MSDSVPSESGRKRPVQELAASIQDTDINDDDLTMPSSSNIQRLALEAIFHPKFENEDQKSQQIRAQMKQNVANGSGYLEVSLKHSGSLLLWSGGERCYSKNSTANTFTYAGQVLLRQHFYRAWYGERQDESIFKQCSQFVVQQRLTLAFEVVTSVLGHHGDLPKRDFLILTAVADKRRACFYTTPQLLDFAHRFRLPHNDVWVYSSVSSVDRLFHLYDTTRETGLATDTIQALDDSANVRVSSMYPHVDFQGNILEGIVIRYVAKQDSEEHLAQVAKQSKDILNKVPSSRPPAFELKSSSPVLQTNIRSVFADCIASDGYMKNLTGRFGDAILAVLQADGSSGRRRAEKRPKKEWDIPKLAKRLLNSKDPETRRVAKVIASADKLRARVDYGVFREECDGKSRWLCIIHVIHDQAFRKFQKKMAPGDMQLYRGFCVELGTDTDGDCVMRDANGSTCPEETVATTDPLGGSLMLKMKFLPYMVRTFGCRNGLRTLQQGGVDAFANYTMRLMTKWGISEASKAKWQRFFRAWATYASACLNKRKEPYINNNLPPLNDAFYLDHLAHFTPLYEAGKIPVEGDNEMDPRYANSTYRALVVVVALKREMALSVADYISIRLGGVKRIQDVNNISDEDLLMMSLPKGGGLVCSATVQDGAGQLRKRMKQYGSATSIVLYGCENENVEAMLGTDRGETIGTIKAWEKTRCASVIKLKQSSLTNGSKGGNSELHPTDEFDSMLNKLNAVSDEVPVADTRPGLLIFFPGIPGSGKSTLCDETTKKALSDFLKKQVKKKRQSNKGNKAAGQRQLTVLVGDRIKKKYWGQVQKERGENSSSIYITDKNAPATAWQIVGGSTGRGIAVPVMPDQRAMDTTAVTGVHRPSGAFDSGKPHHYPFSLEYLAVCMARVMERPPKTHAGKLDSGTPAACMIVIKFFALYRNIAADEFVDSLRMRVECGGGLSTPNPIQIPFFREEASSELPQDLYDSLMYALQMQYGYDLKRIDTTNGKRPEILEVEARLREHIAKYRDMLLSWSADVEVSRTSFIDQVKTHVRELNEQSLTAASPIMSQPIRSDSRFIKLVSLDVPMAEIHDAIKQRAGLLQDFVKVAIEGPIPATGSFSGSDFVPNTHVTLVHFSRMSQPDIHNRFDSVVGQQVAIRVTGLLWNDRIAALAVTLPDETINGTKLYKPYNEFPHVTVWCRKQVKAVESNELPMLVEQEKAQKVELENPFVVTGTLSFWKSEKNSK